MYNDSVIQEQSGLNAFYNKVYSLVGIGVGISALVSGLMMTVFQDFFVQILTTAPMVYYAAVVVELILVFVASGKAVKNSPSALPIFLIYSALNGFTLSFIIARYMQATVYKAFLVSALMFIVMGAIGRVVKKDLSGMGRALMGVLIGVIIASVVNMFLRSSGMDYILSIISVFLFAGLTAWDNQKIRYVYDQTNGQQAGQLPWLWNFILTLSTSLSAFFVSSEKTTNQREIELGQLPRLFLSSDLCYTNSE